MSPILKARTDSGTMNNKLLPGLTVLFLLTTLLGAGATYYYWRQYSEIRANPERVAEEETAALVREVGALILLPEGETPTVATVADIEPLKDQPFFANAKVGDKVLIYTNARRAILYDPVGRRIVEVAPINIGNPGGEAPAAPEGTEPSSE